MTDEYKKLDKTFNITPEVVKEEPKSIERVNPPPDRLTKSEITRDYEYTRGQLYNLIDKGQEAIQGALEVAQESGHPRAYEVATNAMKQVADMTDKLMDLQKKVHDLDEDKKGPTKVTNNAMFVGSTAELQKMLKQMNGGKR